MACTTEGVCEFDTSNDFHSAHGFRNWRYLCSGDSEEHLMDPADGFYTSAVDSECRFGEHGRDTLAPGSLTAIRRWTAPWDGTLSMNVSVSNVAELYNVGECGDTAPFVRHAGNMFSDILASTTNSCPDVWEVTLTFHVLAGDRVDLGLSNAGDGTGDVSSFAAHFKLVADLVPTTYLCTPEGTCVFDTQNDYATVQGFRNWHYMFYLQDGITESLMLYDGVDGASCYRGDCWCCFDESSNTDVWCRYGDPNGMMSGLDPGAYLTSLAAGEHIPIRRWWAPWDGTAHITGYVQNVHNDNCGTTNPQIQHNREIQIEHVVACASSSGGPSTNPKVRWDYEIVLNVQAGDFVDFVLDPYDGGSHDWSAFYAHIEYDALEW
jgi:hypothetical protein